MADWILSILMLAGAGLMLGGFYLVRNGRNPKQGWLMLVAAAVMFGNVAIWTIPAPEEMTAPGPDDLELDADENGN